MKEKRILIIDDDGSVRDAFELALLDGPYIVEVADSGIKGVELANQNRPDLIFCDLKMPKMDGIETIKQLYLIDKKLKVYIVTAFAKEFMLGLKELKSEGIPFELAAKPLGSEQINLIVEQSFK